MWNLRYWLCVKKLRFSCLEKKLRVYDWNELHFYLKEEESKKKHKIGIQYFVPIHQIYAYILFCLLFSEWIKLFGWTVIMLRKIKKKEHALLPPLNEWILFVSVVYVFFSLIFGPKKKSNAKLYALAVIVCVCVVVTSQLVVSNMLKSLFGVFSLSLFWCCYRRRLCVVAVTVQMKSDQNNMFALTTFFQYMATDSLWISRTQIYAVFVSSNVRDAKMHTEQINELRKTKTIIRKKKNYSRKTKNETVKWFVLSVST